MVGVGRAECVGNGVVVIGGVEDVGDTEFVLEGMGDELGVAGGGARATLLMALFK